MSFLNHLINGVSLGSIYAIIALGYTMVMPTEDRFTWEEIVEATALDKKSDGATLRMILLSQIGESVIYPITREQLKPLL